MNRNEAREAVVRTGRLLEERGLTVGTGGNLSVRVEGEELVAIKPSAVPYGLMTPEDVPSLQLGTPIKRLLPILGPTPRTPGPWGAWIA